jgi:hypothetical protein
MDFSHLRALERPLDERDILLGGVVAPATIPATFLPDNTWLQRNFQGKTFFCGEHAGSHLKAILDNAQCQANTRKSPRYGAIKLKDPKSPVHDGYAIDAGTDMRAIFKWLQKVGADDYEPLENDVTLPHPQYCDPSVVTPAMDSNAAQSKIASYGFGNTDFASLQQLIFQNKAVLLLIKCDDGFFGTATPTFTTTKYGHFLVADGYDANNLRVIDSAEPNPAFAVKMIHKQYITPVFIIESGTAVDLAVVQQAVAQVVTQASSIVTQINNSPDMPHTQKLSLLQELAEGLAAVEAFFQQRS